MAIVRMSESTRALKFKLDHIDHGILIRDFHAVKSIAFLLNRLFSEKARGLQRVNKVEIINNNKARRICATLSNLYFAYRLDYLKIQHDTKRYSHV